MKQREWRIPIIVCAVSFFVIAVALVLFFATQFVFRDRFAQDLGRLYSADATLPVSITIYGRGSDSGTNPDTISARIAFYTPEGDLIGTVERSWPGWELKVDCIEIGSPSGWLVFPWFAYTDETTIGHGVDLVRQYARNGFPSIYESQSLSALERQSLKDLFSIVNSESWMPSFLGSLSHQVLSVRKYEPGTEYFLRVLKDGSIELEQ